MRDENGKYLVTVGIKLRNSGQKPGSGISMFIAAWLNWQLLCISNGSILRANLVVHILTEGKLYFMVFFVETVYFQIYVKMEQKIEQLF